MNGNWSSGADPIMWEDWKKSMVDAFPLQWPYGRKRTLAQARKGDPFHMPGGKIRTDLARELHLMGADDFVISSNLAVRRDGLPYANQGLPEDPGIALYFTRKGKQLCFACDQYATTDANLRAIGKTIEAIRGIERWGTEEMMDQAFTGFAELPAQAGQSDDFMAGTGPWKTPQWWEVLEVSINASDEVVKAAYVAKMKKAHPDVGGSHDAAMKIQIAYEQYKQQAKK